MSDNTRTVWGPGTKFGPPRETHNGHENKPMTDLEKIESFLSKLEGLEKGATPGPWGPYWYGDVAPELRKDKSSYIRIENKTTVVGFIMCEDGEDEHSHECDATVICKYRNAAPKLLKAMRVLVDSFEFIRTLPGWTDEHKSIEKYAGETLSEVAKLLSESEGK